MPTRRHESPTLDPTGPDADSGVGMIEWLGWACVAWTIAEALRMVAGALRSSAPAAQTAHAHAAARTGARARRGARRFAAWDDRGRPIDVEDLGRVR